jgi:hypothetical protein
VSYIRPQEEPNRWLQAVLLDMLEQNTEDSRADLKEGITRLAAWIEPGLIDQLFADWVDEYLSLLAELESNRSNDQALCLPEDRPE